MIALRFSLLSLIFVVALMGCATLDTAFNILETVTFPIGVLGTIAGNPVDTYYTVRKVQDWVSKPSSKPSAIEKEGVSTEPGKSDAAVDNLVKSEEENQKLSTERELAATEIETMATEGGEKRLEDIEH